MLLNCLIFYLGLAAANISADSLDMRYVNAYKYLESSSQLRQEISLKLDAVPANDMARISSKVIFIDYAPWCMKKNDTCFFKLEKDERSFPVFNEKYYFKSYENKSLKELNKVDTTDLELYFSKPINNFLFAAVFSTKNGNPFEGLYMGKAVKIVFIFDNENNVVDFKTAQLLIN